MSGLLFNSVNTQVLASTRRPSLHSGSSRRTSTPRMCSLQTSSSSAKDVTSTDTSSPLFVTVPLTLCATFAVAFAWPNTAAAGILSGYKGWELELPRISVPESAKQNAVDYSFAEKQRQKYEQLDEDVKKTPLVQELLKRSQERAARNKKEIFDKYCVRQADWGVGDCSFAFSTPEEKAKFLESLKKSSTEESTEKTTEPLPSTEE